MANLLAQWKKATDGLREQIRAEFRGELGKERVRLVFCRDAPSLKDIYQAPEGMTSIYFTRQILTWEAPGFFAGMTKRIIVFGTREYWKYGSDRSRPWRVKMEPKRSFLPIELAVLNDPTIFLRAATALFAGVTKAQLEAFEKAMKPQPPTSTPPSTPLSEKPFSLSLPGYDDRVGQWFVPVECAKLQAIVKKGGRRCQGIRKKAAGSKLGKGRRQALSVSNRGNELGSRYARNGIVKRSR